MQERERWLSRLGLFSAVGPHAEPPARPAVLGLVLGFAGIALLVGPGLLEPGSVAELGHQPWWVWVPVLGSLSWAWGSLWSRRADMPASGLVSTAVGLTAAGLVQCAVAWGLGDVAAFPLQLTGGNLVRQEHVVACR